MAHTGSKNGRLALGIGLTYLSLLLFLPVSALVVRGLGIPFAFFSETFSDGRVLAVEPAIAHPAVEKLESRIKRMYDGKPRAALSPDTECAKLV